MLADIWTVMAKELREIFVAGGYGKRGLIGLLTFIGIFGVLIPLMDGREWVESPMNIPSMSLLAFVIVPRMVADSFAGERERHTLETLLASRLSDLGIVLGKIGAAIAYGCGLTWLVVCVGWLTVNIAYGSSGLLFISPMAFIGIVGFTILICGAVASAGVLVSLRSPTVRDAQQTFSLFWFLIFISIIASPFLPPKWTAPITRWLLLASSEQKMLAAAGILIVLNIIFITITILRFRRSRLLLD